MSFDKYMGKEHRKPYHGAKAVDPTCRNHGGCPYCEGNRLISRKRKEQASKDKLNEFEKGDVDFE